MTIEQLDHQIELGPQERTEPVIEHWLPLVEAAEAHGLIEAREVFGKIVLFQPAWGSFADQAGCAEFEHQLRFTW